MRCNVNARVDVIHDKHNQINWEVLEPSFQRSQRMRTSISASEKDFHFPHAICLPLSITSVPGAPGPR